MSDFRESQVRDVMTTEVNSVSAATPLRQAVQTMYDTHMTCLVVNMPSPSEGLGILTQKDALDALLEHGPELSTLTVADAMTHPTVILQPGWNLRTASGLMCMLGVRRAPVVGDEDLVGLLTFTDIFRHAVETAA